MRRRPAIDPVPPTLQAAFRRNSQPVRGVALFGVSGSAGASLATGLPRLVSRGDGPDTSSRAISKLGHRSGGLTAVEDWRRCSCYFQQWFFGVAVLDDVFLHLRRSRRRALRQRTNSARSNVATICTSGAGGRPQRRDSTSVRAVGHRKSDGVPADSPPVVLADLEVGAIVNAAV